MTVFGTSASKAIVGEATLLGEYIKNLSFESVRVKFLEFGENLDLEVDVDVNVAELNADIYEVALDVEVHTRNGNDVIYHLELTYGGLFRLRDVPQELRKRLLVGDCSKLLFPSLRRVVS